MQTRDRMYEHLHRALQPAVHLSAGIRRYRLGLGALQGSSYGHPIARDVSTNRLLVVIWDSHDNAHMRRSCLGRRANSFGRAIVSGQATTVFQAWHSEIDCPLPAGETRFKLKLCLSTIAIVSWPGNPLSMLQSMNDAVKLSLHFDLG